MASEITLFDIPTKPPETAWSFNPWKTRLVLNYKNIPYKTYWLEFPDIAPYLESLGIPPNTQGTAYTIPTIHVPSNPFDFDNESEYIVDSKIIATALEARFPDPPLHLDAPELAQAEKLWGKAMPPLLGIFGRGVLFKLLSDRSREYLEPKANLGNMPTDDEAWEAAKPALEAIGVFLKEKGGPFVLGATASYADFIFVSGMQTFKRASEEDFQRFVEIEPACGRLYEASRQWLERDDH